MDGWANNKTAMWPVVLVDYSECSAGLFENSASNSLWFPKQVRLW